MESGSNSSLVPVQASSGSLLGQSSRSSAIVSPQEGVLILAGLMGNEVRGLRNSLSQTLTQHEQVLSDQFSRTDSRVGSLENLAGYTTEEVLRQRQLIYLSEANRKQSEGQFTNQLNSLHLRMADVCGKTLVQSAQFQNMSRRMVNVEQRLDNIQAVLADIRGLLTSSGADAKGAISNWEAEFRQVKSDNASKGIRIEKIESNVSKLIAGENGVSKQLQEIRARVSEVDSRLPKNGLKEVNAAHASLSKDLDGLTSSIKNQEATIKGMIQKQGSIVLEAGSLKEGLSEANKELRLFKEDLKAVKLNVSNIEKKVNSTSNPKKPADTDGLDQLRDLVVRLNSKIDDVQYQLAGHIDKNQDELQRPGHRAQDSNELFSEQQIEQLKRLFARERSPLSERDDVGQLTSGELGQIRKLLQLGKEEKLTMKPPLLPLENKGERCAWVAALQLFAGSPTILEAVRRNRDSLCGKVSRLLQDKDLSKYNVQELVDGFCRRINQLGLGLPNPNNGQDFADVARWMLCCFTRRKGSDLLKSAVVSRCACGRKKRSLKRLVIKNQSVETSYGKDVGRYIADGVAEDCFCDSCRYRCRTVLENLGEQALVLLDASVKDTKNVDFSGRFSYRQKHYRCSGVVQFNEEEKHYRIIKAIYERRKCRWWILDGQCSRSVQNLCQELDLSKTSGWRTYGFMVSTWKDKRRDSVSRSRSSGKSLSSFSSSASRSLSGSRRSNGSPWRRQQSGGRQKKSALLYNAGRQDLIEGILQGLKSHRGVGPLGTSRGGILKNVKFAQGPIINRRQQYRKSPHPRKFGWQPQRSRSGSRSRSISRSSSFHLLKRRDGASGRRQDEERIRNRRHSRSSRSRSHSGDRWKVPRRVGGASTVHGYQGVGPVLQSNSGSPKGLREKSKYGEATIILWNSNGSKNGKASVIKQFARAYDPFILLLNEPRSKVEVSGYSSFQAKAAQAVKEKLNCQILVKGATDFVTTAVGVNVIAIESSSAFDTKTLVVLLYLHPDDELTNDTTKEIVMSVIQPRLSTHTVIVAGDFNATKAEQLSEAAAGDQFYTLLSDMYSSEEKPTSLRSGQTIDMDSPVRARSNQNRCGKRRKCRRGSRCIDWIKSNVELKDLVLDQFQENFSDHKPVAVRFTVVKRNRVSRVPNRSAAFGYMNSLLSGTQRQCSVVGLNDLIKEEISRGRKPYTKICQSDKRVAAPKSELIKDVTTRGFLDRYYEGYRKQLRKIADNRFTPNSREAFIVLRKLSRYNTFERRDGGLVNCALEGGVLLQGGALEVKLMEDFSKIHNLVAGFREEQVTFPRAYFEVGLVRRMMHNVNQDRGIVFDGVTDHWFRIGNDTECRRLAREEDGRLCCKCEKKVQFCFSLLNHSYWDNDQANKHHKARLVCLNKVYPRIPQVHQYRPIIVSSPVIKFIEGAITPSLRSWMKESMEKAQYGFKPGRGIEDCRLNLFQELLLNKRMEIGSLCCSWTLKTHMIEWIGNC